MSVNDGDRTFGRGLMGFGVVLGLMLIGAGLGAGADHWISVRSSTKSAAHAPETQNAAAAASPFLHEGDRIVVPEGSPLRARVAVGPAEVKEIPNSLVLPAAVEADPARTVKVLPPLTGRIIDLKVQLGDQVAKGQALAVLDSGDLAQAYSDDDKARSMLRLTKLTLDRAQGLVKAGGGAVKDLQQAESDYAQAQAEFERAEARLKEIGASAELSGKSRVLTMTAPAAGNITDLQIAPGAFANDPTASIMTIASLDTVWITANVPEKDLAFVTVGQRVDVTLPAYPGKTFTGKVQFISAVLDSDTRRAKTRIAFANPDGALRPGMFANAKFLAPSKPELFVPTSALLMANETTTVFVEVMPWVFERRPIEIDHQEEDLVAVSKGLKDGDRVIVRGGVLLSD
jgi:cobalt-zinc-cadmium efflux system membrane fusion protein